MAKTRPFGKSLKATNPSVRPKKNASGPTFTFPKAASRGPVYQQKLLAEKFVKAQTTAGHRAGYESYKPWKSRTTYYATWFIGKKTAMKNPIGVGTRVAYSKSFLQSTGQIAGEPAPASWGPFARGTVVRRDRAMPEVVEVAWDNMEKTTVLASNLVSVKRIPLESNPCGSVTKNMRGAPSETWLRRWAREHQKRGGAFPPSQKLVEQASSLHAVGASTKRAAWFTAGERGGLPTGGAMPRRNAQGKWREITSKDVGRPTIRAFGRSWMVSGFLGTIYHKDVGKRIYLRGGVLQVENDEQRSRRLGKNPLLMTVPNPGKLKNRYYVLRKFDPKVGVVQTSPIAKAAVNLSTLERWAARKGLLLKPVPGMLFKGYYVDRSTGEAYMPDIAIIKPKKNPEQPGGILLIKVSDSYGRPAYVRRHDLYSTKKTQLMMYTHGGTPYSQVPGKMKRGEAVTIHRDNIARVVGYPDATWPGKKTKRNAPKAWHQKERRKAEQLADGYRELARAGRSRDTRSAYGVFAALSQGEVRAHDKAIAYKKNPLLMTVPNPEGDVVVFRKWQTGYGDVVALFPHISMGRGMVQAYMHVGQHSDADYHHVISKTVPASPKEYAPLKKELEGIGYKIKVTQRARPVIKHNPERDWHKKQEREANYQAKRQGKKGHRLSDHFYQGMAMAHLDSSMRPPRPVSNTPLLMTVPNPAGKKPVLGKYRVIADFPPRPPKRKWRRYQWFFDNITDARKVAHSTLDDFPGVKIKIQEVKTGRFKTPGKRPAGTKSMKKLGYNPGKRYHQDGMREAQKKARRYEMDFGPQSYQTGYQHGKVDAHTISRDDSVKPNSPRIDRFREIVKRKTIAKVDGVAVDLFSASLVVQIYNALSAANKATFMGMKVPQIVKGAYKLAEKVGINPKIKGNWNKKRHGEASAFASKLMRKSKRMTDKKYWAGYGDAHESSKTPPVHEMLKAAKNAKKNPGRSKLTDADMKALMATKEGRKALKLYRKFHGCDPTSITRTVLNIGGPKVTGTEFFVELGNAPAESYETPNQRSSKHGSIYVHPYDRKPKKVVSADGRTIITLPASHKVTDWIRG